MVFILKRFSNEVNWPQIEKIGDYMAKRVYTNYWENKEGDLRKEHGSYETEEEAIQGIEAWWELHGENYSNVKRARTNTGALEIVYGDGAYHYRIEQRMIDDLPQRTYRLKEKGETQALRDKNMLDENSYVFDELSEPLRDRIIRAMADIEKARAYVYDENGRPIKEV